jgi:hypothetical protein
MSTPEPLLQACTLGSTNRPSVCSSEMIPRALSNAVAATPGSSAKPRTRL